MSVLNRSSRWAALCGLAVLFVALATPISTTAQVKPAEEKIPWTVVPDPWPIPGAAPKVAKKTIEIPFRGDILFPETPSPFFALLTPEKKDGTKLQIYDSRTMEPTGKTIVSEKFDPRRVRLSPYGDQILSVDPKADKNDIPAITLFSATDQKVVDYITIHNKAKTKVDALDFAGKNRVLTSRFDDEDPKRVHHIYQVWDTTTGKEVSRLRIPHEYNEKWCAVTPGGRYLVIQETHTANGYNLHFLDLTTGARAGKIVMQVRADGWGQCASIVFSPDGKEAALTWRIDMNGVVLRIQRFDLVKGVKIGEHKLMAPDATPSLPGLLAGRSRTFQFLPDGQAWLLSGHQIVDRETGSIVWKIDPAPRSAGATPDRRFIDSYNLVDVEKKKLTMIELPKADLDAAIKKARTPK